LKAYSNARHLLRPRPSASSSFSFLRLFSRTRTKDEDEPRGAARDFGFASKAAVLLFFACLLSAAANAAPITALAFSPDGSTLISNGARSIEVRSPKDGSIQRRIPCDLSKITSVAFRPRGQVIVVAGGTPGVSGEALLMEWPGQKILHRLTNHTDLATSVAFNADGTLLGVASADHSARLWRVAADGSKITQAFTLTGHAGPVLGIAFSPTGQSVVTASADRSLKVWSTQDGQLLRTLSHHTESVHALAFRSMSSASTVDKIAACASGGDDRTVRIWQPEIGRMVRIIRQHQGPIFALAYSPDGNELFSAGKEGKVRRLDAASDTVLREWSASGEWIYALAISPDGATLATGDWSGAVRLWELRAASEVK
jgi:WD40 repeat protein